MDDATPSERAPREGTVAALREFLSAYESFDSQRRLEWGLSPSEQLVITHLWANDSATMGEIAGEIGMTSGGLTALVDRLDRDGYVRRVRDPEDRRRSQLELTELGTRCRQALEELLEELATAMDADPLVAFLRVGRRLVV